MKKIKSFITFTMLIITTITSFGQVGIGTTTPLGALDITSIDNGLLIPRVALTTTASALPLTLPTTSELVYNTATVLDVTPGYYYWNGIIWVRLAAGITTDWSVTGNTGIVDGTNYIGTAALTNVDVAFRRNNLAAGKIGAASTSFGVGALNVGAATNSTAFGNNAALNTTGSRNVAVGSSSLQANTLGDENVAIGNQALLSNSNSLRNTAIGHRSMATLNSSAWVDNVAIGWQAMADATSGTNSTFVGVQAGRNTTGANSTGIGRRALGSNNGGSSSGIDNTAIGHQALSFNTLGQQNTAIGSEAMAISTVSSFSTAVGYGAMRNFEGSQNTAVGYQAGLGSGTTSGINNVFFGFQAGLRVGTGSSNVLIGNLAGDNTSTGSANIFIGQDAGNLNTTGDFNIGIGANSGNANTTAINNINIGYQAGNSNTGNNNVNIGHQAGFLNTLGGNVNIGYQAGVAETTANKLYITNSNTTPTTSLIYGDFSGTRILRTNSTFQIGDPAGTGYVFPIARGTVNQILQTNAVGVMNWVDSNVKPYATTGAAIGIYNVSLTEYTIRVFNGVSEVTLPSAAGITGKVYVIIGSNGISSKILSTGGGVIYDDVTNTTIVTVNTNQRLMVQSDGTDWIVIGR